MFAQSLYKWLHKESLYDAWSHKETEELYGTKNPSEARWLVCIEFNLAEISGDITSSHG